MERKVIYALLVGTAIRILLSPFFGHPWDMYVWIKVGEMTVEQGINVYEYKDVTNFPWGFYAYPPLWLYWLVVARISYLIFQNLNFYVFMIKLPIIASDLMIAILLYKLGEFLNLKTRKKILLVVAWILNPLPIFISSIWGMFDSLAVAFMMVSLLYLLKKRVVTSSTLLGIGTSIKVFPAFILLPTLFYLSRKLRLNFNKIIKQCLIPFSFPLLLASIPYLNSLNSYVSSMLFQFSHIGIFSYWSFVSIFLKFNYLGYIMFSLFLILSFLSCIKLFNKKQLHYQVLIKSWLITLMLFLVTSPKVSPQFMLWVLPLGFLIISITNDEEKLKNSKKSFLMVNLFTMLFIISRMNIDYMFSLDRLGEMYFPTINDIEILGFLLGFSITYTTYHLIKITIHQLNINLSMPQPPNRKVALTMLTSLIIVLALFPTPKGVELPSSTIRVAIPESVDSAFLKNGDYGVSYFLNVYDITHIVIPLSLDFVNMYSKEKDYTNISKFFRMRISSPELEWNEEDLLGLIDKLKEKGVEVLLGLYLKPGNLTIKYGIQGYETPWLLKLHNEVLDAYGVINFDTLLKPDGNYVKYEVPYVEYFVLKVKEVLSDYGFDGLYLMDWDWERDVDGEGLMKLLVKLYPAIKRYGKTLFIEGPDIVFVREEIIRTINYSDFLVMKASPWIASLYGKERKIFSLQEYEDQLKEILNRLSKDDRQKVMLGIYTMDFVEGKFTPAAILQAEADALLRRWEVSGYSIYHTNRYLPYRLSIER